jgi:hypothetical protein
MQVFMYYKACPDDNEYAHPMDLCPVVDLYAGKVIHIDAYSQPPAIPMRSANYHRYWALCGVKMRQVMSSFDVSGVAKLHSACVQGRLCCRIAGDTLACTGSVCM